MLLLIALSSVFFFTNLNSYPQEKQNLKPTQEQATYTWEADSPVQDALSMMIVDLKFDGKNIKICELGEGIESRYQGYDSLYGKGSMWGNIWHALAHLKKPLWVVERDFWARNRHEYTFDKLKLYGGNLHHSLQSIENNRTLQLSITRHPAQNQGILVSPSLGAQASFITSFRAKYPQFIHLDAKTNHYVRTKDAMIGLFKEANALGYRPKSKIYKKAYTATIGKTVMEDFKDHELLVIKPTNSSLGYGVIMTPLNDVDTMLRMIISQKQQLKKFGSDPSYTYWNRDENKEFIIESYAPSKHITIDGESYDATLRVVCLIGAHNSTRFITFIGSYWKLPSQPLSASCLITEKLKSHISCGKVSSAKVDTADYAHVQQELTECFKKLSRVFFR